jgi:hypothetical protein
MLHETIIGVVLSFCVAQWLSVIVPNREPKRVIAM